MIRSNELGWKIDDDCAAHSKRKNHAVQTSEKTWPCNTYSIACRVLLSSTRDEHNVRVRGIWSSRRWVRRCWNQKRVTTYYVYWIVDCTHMEIIVIIALELSSLLRVYLNKRAFSIPVFWSLQFLIYTYNYNMYVYNIYVSKCTLISLSIFISIMCFNIKRNCTKELVRMKKSKLL